LVSTQANSAIDGAAENRIVDAMTGPAISVITATYNRSNVLQFTIESLLRSAFDDWELLVIGDACTDNTAEVVSSFADSRIRFINLNRNFGEQSGPNNEGVKLAHGRYIAFLNHDDFYFSDHLGMTLHCLEEEGADLVFAATAAAQPRTPEELVRRDWRFRLYGVSPTGRYEPYLFAPASSWLLRRTLIESIGPWRPALECRIESSQEFLFRAYKAGKTMRFTRHLSVLAVQSGARKGVYRQREAYENEYYGGQLRNNPRFREQLLSHVSMELAGQASVPKLHFSFGRALRKLIYRPALRLGLHPRATRAFLKGRGKGASIIGLRRIRGLDPLPSRTSSGTGSMRNDSSKES
jgi:glycosyltransferase involved in cell wall biosynthesis